MSSTPSKREEAAEESLTLAPTSEPRVFRAPDGRRLSPPDGWECLPPGDAALTRRVKALGPSWAVVEKRGRKTFSRGVWAPAENIEAARLHLNAQRADPAHARRQAAGVRRRQAAQDDYVTEFTQTVRAYLAFAPCYADLGERLARAVAEHATPVGSGTVARTKRIPVQERAAAAVIAWLRHQTTAYDQMKIARVRGERRRVRRQLASVSQGLLDRHRQQEERHPAESCPLCRALPQTGGEREAG